MGIDKDYTGIDEYAVRIITFKAQQLVGRVGFSESDREDIEQDLLLDLLQRLPRYNPERSQRTTFISRVVDHRIATIIEARKAGLRDYRICTCSLNDLQENKEDGGCVERVETIDQDDYFLSMGTISRASSELRDLSLDLRDALEKLPPNVRDLCLRLATDTVSEISRDRGIPRGTVYEGIRKIRAIFEDSGLGEYLSCRVPQNPLE